MALIKDEDRQILTNEFSVLGNDVNLIYFSKENDCDYCEDIKNLLDEVGSLSTKINITNYDMEKDAEKAKQFNIDKAPAIVFTGNDETDNGVKYFGLPAGYEFAALVGTILNIGKGEVELSDATKEAVKAIDKPVHLQVFVTPSCPHCPGAARTAHQLALLNENITADVVEATEFPELSTHYNVRGVPRVVINEDHHFEGNLPEPMYLQKVLQTLNPQTLN